MTPTKRMIFAAFAIGVTAGTAITVESTARFAVVAIVSFLLGALAITAKSEQ